MRALFSPFLLLLLAGLLAIGFIGYGFDGHGLTRWPVGTDVSLKQGSTWGGDFRLFYAQASLIRSHLSEAELVYDAKKLAEDPLLKTAPVQVRPSFYPPSFLVAISPLAFIPFEKAFWLFQWGGVLALGLGLVFAFKKQPELWALGLGFGGVWRCLNFGQTSLYITALVLISMAGLARFPRAGGFCLGLATVKPHLGVAFPFQLLWRQNWAVIFGAVASSLLLLAGAWVMLGPQIFKAYAEMIAAPVSRLGSLASASSDMMASVYVAGRQLGFPLWGAAVLQGLSALYALWRLYNICDYVQDTRVSFAAAITASLLMTPHLYVYDFALLVVPFLVCVQRAQRIGWTAAALCLLPLIYASSYFIVDLSIAISFPLAPLTVVMLHELLWQTERQIHVHG